MPLIKYIVGEKSLDHMADFKRGENDKFTITHTICLKSNKSWKDIEKKSDDCHNSNHKNYSSYRGIKDRKTKRVN
jgi:hypothetical protein